MTERRAPGVYASVFSSAIPEVREVSPAQYFAAGLYEWGPVNKPIYVVGIDDFRLNFGDNVFYSPAPEHFEAAFGESRDTLSGWIVRVFDTRPSFQGRLAAPVSAGDTSVFLDRVVDLRAGDRIFLSGAGSAPYEITSVDTANGSITLENPALGAVGVGTVWQTEGKQLDDYKARVDVRDRSNVKRFRIIAIDPGSKGNTFRLEIAPGGLNPRADVLMRVRGRYKNFDFEWKGVGEPPAVVQNPGAGATPQEIAEYTRYQYEKQAYDIGIMTAVQANREMYARIRERAANRDIDFDILIDDETDDAFFRGNIQPTQPAIYNTRISADALEFFGGANGELVDSAPVGASKEFIRGRIGYDLIVGKFDSNGVYTGLQALNDEFYGTGAVMLPGQFSREAWNALIEHAEVYNRLGLANVKPGTAPQTAALLKAEFGGSSNFSLYYGISKKKGVWVENAALAAGVGSRETARQDQDGGIKASWTGLVTVEAVEQFYGRDAVDRDVAELFSRADVGLNYVQMVPGMGYRLDSQRLSLPKGAISRVYHTIVNNTMVYSIKPAVAYMRDRTIDRDGSLVEDFINAVDSFLADYKPGRPAPRGNTLWGPAVVFDASTLNDLRNLTLRMHIQYAQSPKAERIMIGIEQTALEL